MTKRIVTCLVPISLLATSLVSVASAAPLANPQTKPTMSPFRIASVTGANAGIVIINTNTGLFACIAEGGLVPGTTYYLQYHVTGSGGAGVIGSGTANHAGVVIIVGKLDRANLDLIALPGNFLIGKYVV